MDSSHSGSFQSSSGAAGGGGDNEEYDSRTQSISSFLNPSSHFNHLLQPPPPPSYHHQPPPPTDTTFFNPFQDPGSVWTGPIQPDRSDRNNLTDFNTYRINPMDTNTQTGRGSDHHNHNHQIGVTIKNPKKRTRASRRAPTTVLTTDTTNFRQMVQEFTGIPTAPFTTPPFSRRLDLFGGEGGSLYPLRPAAQKIQPQPPPFSNSIVDSGTSNNITAATTSSKYQLPPSNIHEFQKQPSTLLDSQNPMLSFQSLLQSTLSQQSNDLTHLSGFPSASKRWRDQDEKLESLEGVFGNSQDIGGSKLNSGGGDQVQGNEGSWICPPN